MISQVCVIRDLKAEVWGQPYFVNSIGGATRSFMDELKGGKDPNGQSSVLAQHPEDFELWHIGNYDDATCELGTFAPHERKRLFSGSDL